MILDRRGQAAGDEQAGLGHQLSWTVSTAFTLPPLRATTAWSGACCDRRPETKPLLWLSNNIAGRASGVSVTKLQSTAPNRCAWRTQRPCAGKVFIKLGHRLLLRRSLAPRAPPFALPPPPLDLTTTSSCTSRSHPHPPTPTNHAP